MNRLWWRRVPLHELPPIIVHGAEVQAATREEDAQLVEAACEWSAGSSRATHAQYHYGYPCPYVVAAALIRGKPDPRQPR